MSLSWSSSVIKYLLFVFNFAFFITGIIILSVGVSVKAYYHNYEEFLDDQYFSAPNLLIAIGTIIFIIAFFGCCGAIKENYCLIISFSTSLILVFILQLAAGIAGYALRNQTGDYLNDKLFNSLSKYNDTHADEITKIWDLIQKEFSCCGVNGPSDWVNNTTSTDRYIPMSCCATRIGAVGNITCNLDSPELYTEGCVQAFGDFLESHAVTIGGVGIGFAMIQLLGIIFSCHLSKQIKLQYDYM